MVLLSQFCFLEGFVGMESIVLFYEEDVQILVDILILDALLGVIPSEGGPWFHPFWIDDMMDLMDMSCIFEFHSYTYHPFFRCGLIRMIQPYIGPKGLLLEANLTCISPLLLAIRLFAHTT